MIEKLPGCVTNPSTIVEALNEVIDYINERAVLEETDHPEVAEAAKKAVRTGTHADLKIWLDLRRKYL